SFFSSSRYHPDLHSFPTRRSSDLTRNAATTARFTDPRHVGGRSRRSTRAARLRASLPPALPRFSAAVGRRPVRPRASITPADGGDRKSIRLNSSHGSISYAVFCLK